MKFEPQIEIEEGDIIIFNDEEWYVIGFDGFGHRFDAQSVDTGRVESFKEDELAENIKYSGKFSLIKSDYVGVF